MDLQIGGKKMKRIMIIVLVIILCIPTVAFANSSFVQSYDLSFVAKVKGPNSNDIGYYASRTYWINNGTKLVVEGSFFNFTSDYDFIELVDTYINIVDKHDNVVARVKVNENNVSVIPHNGAYPYNFTVSSIPGGSSTYKASELFPRLETDFTYVQHQSQNCPYCGNISITNHSSISNHGIECEHCHGTGYVTCPDCGGTGKLDNSITGVIRSIFGGKCQRCDGKGKIFCNHCHGLGYIE